jgi:predicted ribosomally synthesized peptide with SipW-like signal peptide
MKLFSIRNLAMTGALSVAGLGLVGMGAHAVFTQSTTSQQDITAGTMNVTLYSATASGGNNTPSLTLASAGPETSTFMSTYGVTITNNSNIPVNEIAYTLTDPGAYANGASLALNNQVWACLYSNSPGNQWIYFNEPLTTAISYGQSAVIEPLAAGASDNYTLIIYAGTVNTGCGGVFTGWSAAPYTSADGVVIPHSYTSGIPIGGPPALGGNSASLSLDNSAQGGVITPTLTVDFSA